MSESVQHVSVDLDIPVRIHIVGIGGAGMRSIACLLYTSDAADDL